MTAKEQVIQQLEIDGLVELFTLDATEIGGDLYRWCSSVNNTNALEFDGIVYVPRPAIVEGFERNAKGAFPTPSLKVHNVDNLISQLCNSFADLLGAKFTRLRTLRRYLDGMPEADPTAVFPPDEFQIERKKAENNEIVEFELSAVIDQQGRKLPGRQILRDVCTHRYRVWNPVTQEFDYSKASCPYVGARSFDRHGVETTPDNDQCSKLLRTGCIARFGADPLPTRAFPAVGRVRQ
jgi:lambda family phage minor tail protein L